MRSVLDQAPHCPAPCHTMPDPRNIRNFSIIAHIDHGKTTLSDRLLQKTGAVESREMDEQMLDDMDLERERGITIKARAVTLKYTRQGRPGVHLQPHRHARPRRLHLRSSRSLAACEGAMLVVDATQGVEAQTLANSYLAINNNLDDPVRSSTRSTCRRPSRSACASRSRTSSASTRTTPCWRRRRRASASTRSSRRSSRNIPAPKGDPDGAAARAALRLLVRLVSRRRLPRAHRRRRAAQAG